MTDIATILAERLRDRADPSAAPAMQAYMKSEMPFMGVRRPAMAAVARQALREFAPVSNEEYRAHVRALWCQPHREEKYLAIALARGWRRYVSMQNLDLYRTMIVEGAWWDFVDEIATAIVGRLLLEHRAAMNAVLDRWIDDPDVWLRRSALLAHERHGTQTDREKLSKLIDRVARVAGPLGYLVANFWAVSG